MDILSMSACDLSRALSEKKVSALEVTQCYLKQIEEKEPSVSAYLTVDAKGAIEKAKEVDQKRAAGEPLSPYAGIPIGIKDNICTKGLKTTCASKMLEHFVPPYDATVIERLRSRDMVILGKLNMDEFAMGSSTENSYFGVTKNPRALDRVPGGSSGGSAAAVAALEAPLTLGSDTGGSIRQPAAFCGVVGVKPTYGTVSRYGLVAFASSLDQIGPLSRNVSDSAFLLNALAGHDPKDATSLSRDYDDFKKDIDKGVEGLRIALPKEFFGEGLNKEVKEAVLSAAKTFESLGAKVEEVSLPSLSLALPAYYVLSSAEASSNLARFDGIRYGYRSADYSDMDSLYKKTRSEGFGDEVKRRIMLGTFALSSGYYDAYYKKALQVRSLIVSDYQKIFKTCDVILSPVAPTTAYKIGEKTSDPMEMYLGDIYTVPVNIAGIPALSMPCGKDQNGLPIGLHLMGDFFSEPTLYRAAAALEKTQKGGSDDAFGL